MKFHVYLQSEPARPKPPEYDSDIVSENQLKDSKIGDLTRVSIYSFCVLI